MKKSIAIAMCAAMAATVFCGCGNAESKGDKVKIGVSLPAADHGWSGGIVWFAEHAKKEIEAANPDAQVIVTIGKDAAEQHDKIENLVTRGIDSLVVVCQEPGPVTPACVAAHKSGVYVVVANNTMLDETCQDVFIDGDNRSLGEEAARAIGALVGGKGDVLVMEGIPCPVNSARIEGFNAVMAAEFPDIKILESQPAWWDTEKGMNLMETYLQKYKKIDALWAGDDDVLVGALRAYENSGRSDIKAIVGGGGSKIVVKKVMDKDPVVRATVTYSPKMVYDAIYKALEGVRNGKKPVDGISRISIKSHIVTPENASEYYYPDSVY